MNYFYFILFFGVCSCLDSEGSESYPYNSYVTQHHSGIVWPCQHLDLNCIRNFLAHYSDCTPAYGSPPDPLSPDATPIDIPHANLTFVLTNAVITGLSNFKIGNFYLNNKSGTLVLELLLPAVKSYSPEVEVTYHRKGHEPVIVRDYAGIVYGDTSLTITFPVRYNKIQISGWHVFSYAGDANPPYTLAPKFINHPDRTVRRATRELVHEIGLTLQEALAPQGPVFSRLILQNSICNFWHPSLFPLQMVKI
ncbi:unnamed protein product [Chrysodeixis includens]|uniref:Uncharacterized protein n=1 Tax=Chrysodeixis includens TaxID=689277 RepID=A0A9P0G190_CHRIL|nr:unnamed protein product [Chrysodeixis includens]